MLVVHKDSALRLDHQISAWQNRDDLPRKAGLKRSIRIGCALSAELGRGVGIEQWIETFRVNLSPPTPVIPDEVWKVL